MEFSRLQLQALEKVNAWLKAKDKPFFYLAGYAGTGKTTLAKHLVEGIEGEVLFGAFTGKAASVLRKMGCPNARTLHSILYSAGDDLIAEQIKLLRQALAKEGWSETEREEMKKELKELRARRTGPTFRLNPDSPLATAKILVLDECSMVNKDLAQDALSFRTPILVLGDPGQLPPVKGAGYFTARAPDHLLTEIHRQAADNPIIRWATMVREGTALKYQDDGLVRKVHRGDVDFERLQPEVQVLTGKNAVRRELNLRMRFARGFREDLPEKGEKLVCLKNDSELGLLNGVICEAGSDAERVGPEELSMAVVYDGMYLDELPVASLPFERYTDPELEDDVIDRYLQQFDYGYALTVHKSQGSQWDTVVLADDGFAKWDVQLRRKWLYTAITRAQRCLTIVA